MEISAKRNHDGEYLLELGPVTLTLPSAAIKALTEVIDQRLNQSDEKEQQELQKKLAAYKALATKMSEVDDRIVQTFAPQVTPEQLVTIVRLAEGDVLREKVLRNLSKQNRRQFEEDYAALNKITVHQACLYMEQLVPLIKKVAQQQKALHESIERGE
ncbi:MAG: hypothetical protein IE937_02895 [Gammaproteobacteria bacterium]|jgi:flagellar motor switch protein FliG|nr:hypothetical protein [Gammaproteobacteria bacterium]MBD3776304.1 hypothetical protein [Thiotrichales bacterium]